MASSTHFHIILFVFGYCSFFLDDLAAEGDNQDPGVSGMEGQGSSFFFYQKSEYPRDCSEVHESCSSSVSSGVYVIKPDGYSEPFEAYCDNHNDSGGWTVIQRRLFDGFIDFQRDWSEYKSGFGFLSTEFWLGNEKVSFLTNQRQYELRIDITLDNGTSCEAKYNAFRISDEWSHYTISTVGTYESDEVSACKWKEERELPIDVSTNFSDCNDVYNAGNRQDGVYLIRPEGWNGSPFEVFCNMTIDGGAWTVFQRRVNGSTDFYRNWTEYREGFGSIEHEFWIGNEKLYHLTNQSTYEYRVDFVWSSNSYHHKYTSFRIDDETNKYRVTEVGTRTGTRGYSFYSTKNVAFSTHDQDNDGRSGDCAEGHRGGWWYGGIYNHYSNSDCYNWYDGSTYRLCSFANLNADYSGGNGKNVFDVGAANSCSIKYVEMKIRRTSW